MPTDPNDVDFYTPEQRREMLEKIAPVGRPSAWSSFKDSIAIPIGVSLWIGVWIITILVALVVGIAIVKWAFEELAK